ncbi:MAG: hypothetical protein ABSE00_02175 [Chitinispirillaceae bacterium]|jgi:hypothetical protein
MNEHSCYLLLNTIIPSRIMPPPSVKNLEGIISAQQSGKILGIEIRPIRLISSDQRGYFRYIFFYPRYNRNDRDAQYIGDCFLNAFSVLNGPINSQDETQSVFRFPANLIYKKQSILIEKLLEIERLRPFKERDLISLYMSIMSIPVMPIGNLFDKAWRMTPILKENKKLFEATRFFSISQTDFYVAPGQIPEILSDPSMVPITSGAQSKFENSLQNAFKAIEALIGDPPKDDRKLFHKLKEIGVNPSLEFDTLERKPIHTIIRKMNDARDKKSAHGSTPRKKPEDLIAAKELMEYQFCARFIILTAIELEMKKMK